MSTRLGTRFFLQREKAVNMPSKHSAGNHSRGTPSSGSDALQKHLDAFKSKTDIPAGVATCGKTCAICGKRFTWYWRRRYQCAVCGSAICSDCYLEGMLPRAVREFDYAEYTICLRCAPAVQREIEDQGLQSAVLDYKTGLNAGNRDGAAGFQEKPSLSDGFSVHYLKGYEAGHKKGSMGRTIRDGLRDGFKYAQEQDRRKGT